MTYAEWIAANVQDDGYGQCEEVTLRMAEAFPELRRVRGHYYDLAWGQRGHWWMVDASGKVVDPTVAQFPSKGRGFYDEWDESRPEPIGECYQCGAYIYEGAGCPNECDDQDGFYDRLRGLSG
jgi:hypothetical protein